MKVCQSIQEDFEVTVHAFPVYLCNDDYGFGANHDLLVKTVHPSFTFQITVGEGGVLAKRYIQSRHYTETNHCA